MIRETRLTRPLSSSTDAAGRPNIFLGMTDTLSTQSEVRFPPGDDVLNSEYEVCSDIAPNAAFWNLKVF